MKLLRFSINHNSSIFMLGCLNPNEANFEDSLNTLSLLDRCKNYEELNKDGVTQAKELEKKVSRIEFFGFFCEFFEKFFWLMLAKNQEKRQTNTRTVAVGLDLVSEN